MKLEKRIRKTWRKIINKTLCQLHKKHFCGDCGLMIFREKCSRPDAQGRCIKANGGIPFWVRLGTPACNYWEEPKYRGKRG